MSIFQEHQTLFTAVIVVGFAFSAWFYYSGFRKLLAARPADGAVSRRLRLPEKREGAGRLVTPPAQPIPPVGQQADLLAGLAKDDVDEQDRTTTEGTAPGYGVDQGRTTRLEQRTPLGQRKTLPQLPPPPIAKTTDDGLHAAIRDAVEDSLNQAFGLDDAGPATEVPTTRKAGAPAAKTETPEPPVAAPASSEPVPEEPKRKRSASGTELIRKAKRHEELGLHIGIKPDILGEQQRLATKDLDAILAKLDDALGASAPAGSSASTPASDPAAANAASTLPAADTATQAPLTTTRILPAPTEPAAPAPAKPAVPSWARADSFDEDAGKKKDTPGQQHSLFE